MHRPVPLLVVPFLGGYISCPSHDNNPPQEEKTRKRTKRSVDGCRMKSRRGSGDGWSVRENATSAKRNEAMSWKRNTLEDRKEKLHEVKKTNKGSEIIAVWDKEDAKEMCANVNSDLKVQCVQFFLIYDIYVGNIITYCPSLIKGNPHRTMELIWFSYTY